MSNHGHIRPQPLLVLVTGKPGSGKSTLAIELGRAEQLGLPVLSRDAIKAGMVETWAFAQPGANRTVIESDERRATLVPQSFDLFYQTIARWLDAGISLIAGMALIDGRNRHLPPSLLAPRSWLCTVRRRMRSANSGSSVGSSVTARSV